MFIQNPIGANILLYDSVKDSRLEEFLRLESKKTKKRIIGGNSMFTNLLIQYDYNKDARLEEFLKLESKKGKNAKKWR